MIWVYILIGFLFIRWCIALWNIFGDTKLSKTPFTEANDFISILIPAKNEEHNIIPLLYSILSQDYQNYEVIVLDDASDDGTLALVQNFTKRDSRFKIVSGIDLPIDWLGKNFACHQLSMLASGSYFLFLDADVEIKSGLINRALSRVKSGGLSLLSLFSDQKMESIGEWLTVPLMNYFLLSFLPLNQVKRSSQPTIAAANGQFMLFPKENYHEHRWHAQVKGKVAEDYEICKLLKTKNYKVETLLGDGYLSCRMYKGLREGIDGFTKNTFALFNYNLFGILLFALMIFGLDIILILLSPWKYIQTIFLLILGLKWILSWLSRQNIGINLILHPFQMGFMVYICLLSVIKNYRGTVLWKGRPLEPWMVPAVKTSR